MSRLDSVIRRLTAQRDVLDAIVGEIGLGVHQLWAADGDGVPASPGDA